MQSPPTAAVHGQADDKLANWGDCVSWESKV